MQMRIIHLLLHHCVTGTSTYIIRHICRSVCPPGELFSDDDMYITSSKMVVLETTNHIYNFTILKVGFAATATNTITTFSCRLVCDTQSLDPGTSLRGVNQHHIDCAYPTSEHAVQQRFWCGGGLGKHTIHKHACVLLLLLVLLPSPGPIPCQCAELAARAGSQPAGKQRAQLGGGLQAPQLRHIQQPGGHCSSQRQATCTACYNFVGRGGSVSSQAQTYSAPGLTTVCGCNIIPLPWTHPTMTCVCRM